MYFIIHKFKTLTFSLDIAINDFDVLCKVGIRFRVIGVITTKHDNLCNIKQNKYLIQEVDKIYR